MLDLSKVKYVTISFNVPQTHSSAVRLAIGKAGAGCIGNYTYCSFSVLGIGRFLPNRSAKPFIGTAGVLEEVMEEKIETVCRIDQLEGVVAALKQAHPYEEFTIDVIPSYRASQFSEKT